MKLFLDFLHDSAIGLVFLAFLILIFEGSVRATKYINTIKGRTR